MMLLDIALIIACWTKALKLNPESFANSWAIASLPFGRRSSTLSYLIALNLLVARCCALLDGTSTNPVSMPKVVYNDIIIYHFRHFVNLLSCQLDVPAI